MNKNKKVFNFIYNEKYVPFGLIKNNEIDKVEFNKWRKNYS